MKFGPTIANHSHSQSIIIGTRTNVIERQLFSNPKFSIDK